VSQCRLPMGSWFMASWLMMRLLRSANLINYCGVTTDGVGGIPLTYDTVLNTVLETQFRHHVSEGRQGDGNECFLSILINPSETGTMSTFKLGRIQCFVWLLLLRDQGDNCNLCGVYPAHGRMCGSTHIMGNK
jgi:hypothetical protein